MFLDSLLLITKHDKPCILKSAFIVLLVMETIHPIIEAVLAIGGMITMFLAGVWVGKDFNSFNDFAIYFIDRLKPETEKCYNVNCIEGRLLHLGESHENASWVDCPICYGTGEKNV